MRYPLTRLTLAVGFFALFMLSFSTAAICLAHAASPGATPTPFATAAAPQPASAYPTIPRESPSAKPIAWRYSGVPVDFELTGLEPDFDPIYKLIVSTKLHDLRDGISALPDATLILSAYLEVFQPDTTPLLPDLLHPNRPANDLAGFLSGAAALVNRGGHVVYKGSLLAEVFQNSTEHLIIDLDPVNARAGWGSVRLQGAIILHKGGKETGTLEALQPLARQALAVPLGTAPTWKAVIGRLTVHLPPMMGTAGSPGAHASATPATIAHLAPVRSAPTSCLISCRLRGAFNAVRDPTTAIPLALGVAILCLGGILIRRRRPAALPTVSGDSQDGHVTD